MNTELYKVFAALTRDLADIEMGTGIKPIPLYVRVLKTEPFLLQEVLFMESPFLSQQHRLHR